MLASIPKKIWLKIEKAIMDLPSLDSSSRMLQRLMVGHASEIVLDSHNRILVPIELRRFSGIKKSVVVYWSRTTFLKFGIINHGISQEIHG